MTRAHLDWRIVDDATGLVDVEQWRFRCTVGYGVGRCGCGGSLTPETPERDRPNVTWLAAECSLCRRRIVQVAERPVRAPRALTPA